MGDGFDDHEARRYGRLRHSAYLLTGDRATAPRHGRPGGASRATPIRTCTGSSSTRTPPGGVAGAATRRPPSRRARSGGPAASSPRWSPEEPGRDGCRDHGAVPAAERAHRLLGRLRRPDGVCGDSRTGRCHPVAMRRVGG